MAPGGNMGILKRLSDLLVANVHALLDRAEDPELMLGQVVRELDEGLTAARAYAATTLAVEKRIGRDLEQSRSTAARWEVRAREAVRVGREDLARRALLRKHEEETLVSRLEAEHTT